MGRKLVKFAVPIVISFYLIWHGGRFISNVLGLKGQVGSNRTPTQNAANKPGQLNKDSNPPSFKGRSVSKWMEALTDNQDSVRVAAYKELLEIQETPTQVRTLLPSIVEILRVNDDDHRKRRGAAYVLGACGKHASRAVPALRAALKDSYWPVRLASAEALAKIGLGAESAVPDLLKAMKDPHESVRWAAYDALEAVADEALRERGPDGLATDLGPTLRIGLDSRADHVARMHRLFSRMDPAAAHNIEVNLRAVESSANDGPR